MTVDHIVPLAAGGTNIEENLWLACNRCNGFKGVQTRATDPLTGEPTALFNPRLQSWTDHFAWSDDSTAIIGRTPVGRATIDALKLNNPEIVVTRRLWVQVGWWPQQN